MNGISNGFVATAIHPPEGLPCQRIRGRRLRARNRVEAFCPRWPRSDIVERQMARHVFTGGLRMSWFNATWPFARMTVDDEGIVVRVLGFAAFQTGWPALTRAERVVGGLFGSAGVRLTRNRRPSSGLLDISP